MVRGLRRQAIQAAIVAVTIVAGAVGLGGLPVLAQDEDRSPEALVARLHDALIEVMQNADALGFQGRFDQLDPTVRDTFNLYAMAQVTLGREAWSGLTDDQKQAYADAFARMSIANYASNFDGYSGESFTTLGLDDGPRGAIIVRSQINLTDDDPVRLDYIIRDIGGEQSITDVLLDGSVSELARRRSELSSVFAQSGFEGAVDAMEAQIARLSGEG